ncbi:MAG: copper chaperone PCu(A)C [Ignavibacteriaceae bacterium]
MNILIALLIIFSNPTEKIKIVDPWMRVGAQGKPTGAFFKIENNSDKADTLYKVESELSRKVEIHETYQKDDMMGMREVGQIIIPAKSSFELKPGSFHIMLIGLKQDVKKGDEGELILYFKNAGEIKIKMQAKDMPMKKMEHKH